MYGIHPQLLADRKEDRRKDQTGRCHIHECTDNQQKDIDDKENDVTVIADA